MIVGAGIAGDEQDRARRQLSQIAVLELMKCIAVVGMAVEPYHLGFGTDAAQCLGEISSGTEELGYLVDRVDEGERSHPAELVGQRKRRAEA